jgi:hypothetical protein
MRLRGLLVAVGLFVAVLAPSATAQDASVQTPPPPLAPPCWPTKEFLAAREAKKQIMVWAGNVAQTTSEMVMQIWISTDNWGWAAFLSSPDKTCLMMSGQTWWEIGERGA